ncbi:hypothetical protein M2150_001043 [Lachnospiraceae bacterium PM6-15]|uniref:hypothetical protein n=1 Tax=Ohessyouella blattaphilus TaxID=2949333 RepID=UPI003E180171
MSAYNDVFQQIINNCSKIANETFAHDTVDAQSRQYAFVADYEFWITLVSNCHRRESVLYNFALREYNVGQVLLTQGFYRQAFQSLRSFLETTLFAISLSTNEIDLNLWLKDGRDLYWSSIIDSNKGVFSSDFFTAFCPLLIEYREEFRELAILVYRECSEYVHGNYGAQSSLPLCNSFDSDVFANWHRKAEIIQRILTMMLFVRYNLSVNSKSDLVNVEAILTNYVGNLPEFSTILTAK